MKVLKILSFFQFYMKIFELFWVRFVVFCFILQWNQINWYHYCQLPVKTIQPWQKVGEELTRLFNSQEAWIAIVLFQYVINVVLSRKQNSLIFKVKWYRFEGDAGTQLADRRDPQKWGTCGTSRVAWMRGDHPTIRYAVDTSVWGQEKIFY